MNIKSKLEKIEKSVSLLKKDDTQKYSESEEIFSKIPPEILEKLKAIKFEKGADILSAIPPEILEPIKKAHKEWFEENY